MSLNVEALSRIGQLALKNLDRPAFLEEVLTCTMEGLGGDAALVLLRAEGGRLDSAERGDVALCGRMLALTTVPAKSRWKCPPFRRTSRERGRRRSSAGVPANPKPPRPFARCPYQGFTTEAWRRLRPGLLSADPEGV